MSNSVLDFICGLALLGLIIHHLIVYRDDLSSEVNSDPLVEDDELIHVGYTPEQMGYEK